MKIDEIDLQIIDLLKHNGRTQNNEIACRLSISEGTVRNRIKKLIDCNFLSIQGLVNPEQIKKKQIIFLAVQIAESKNLEKTAQRVARLEGVNSVYMVTGRYDLLIEIFIEPQNLINFLSNHLAKIDFIASTESFLTLRSYNRWI